MSEVKKTSNILEKGRISPLQLSFLALTLVIATADVFLPAYVAQEAAQDSWLSVIIGTITSLLIAIIFLTLGMKYPDKTIIQYARDILGKPIGTIIGLLYIVYYIHVCSSVTHELGEIFVTAFNPDSPLYIYCIITVLVAAYAVHNGLEVIARVNQFLLPAGFAILGIIALTNIPNMDLNNYLPVLSNGMLPPLKGAFMIQTWIIEVALVLQFIPFVRQQHKIKKHILISIVFLGISLEFGVLVIAVFGPLTSKLLFPALEYVRYAQIGEHIENLDITIMGVWIAGICIKIAIFYYAVVLAISQLFKFKSYKPMIVPVGLLITVMSLTSVEHIIGIFEFAHYIFPFYSITMSFVIPLLLLTVCMVRGKPGLSNTLN